MINKNKNNYLQISKKIHLHLMEALPIVNNIFDVYANNLDSEVKKYLGVIHDNIQHIINIHKHTKRKSKDLDFESIKYKICSYSSIIVGCSEYIVCMQIQDKLKSRMMELIVTIKQIQALSEQFFCTTDTVSFVQDEVYNYINPTYSGNILIIDNNEHNLELIERKLINSGYNIVTFNDSHKALGFIDKNKVDLILIDFITDLNERYSFIQNVRSNSNLCDIPIIIISCSNNVSHIIKSIRFGADDYIKFDTNDLLIQARIKSFIAKKIFHDKEQRVLHQLIETKNVLHIALENINDGFAVFDNNNDLLISNNALKKVYTDSDNIDFKNNYKKLFAEIFNKKITKQGYTHTIQLNPQKWVEIFINLLPNGNTVTVHKDISKQKLIADNLRYEATHDKVTGIYNRSHFDYMLNNFFSNACKTKINFGVMFFDIDDFKVINDKIGHDFGDFVLKKIASRLQRCFRTQDLFARIGGDEFAVIIVNTKDKKLLEKIANRCLVVTNKLLRKNKFTVKPKISIGIACYDDSLADAKELLKNADNAMYNAKKTGKNTFSFAK